MSSKPSADVQSQYDALTRGAGICEFSQRTQIEITGRDRAALLHGLCTNDVKRLTPGEGCETFLTNAQGRTVGRLWSTLLALGRDRERLAARGRPSLYEILTAAE